MLGYSDSHVHLIDYSDEGLEYIFRSMSERNVDFAVSVAVNVDTSKVSVELAQQRSPAVAAIGIHPWFAATLSPADKDLMDELAASGKAKALGEVGLDYSPRDKLPAGPTEAERAANPLKMPKLPEKTSSPEAQRDVFAFEVELAAKYGLPLNVHSRGGADRDAFDILSRPWKGEVRGIAHGFDGDLAALKGWLDIGFSIALGYGQVIARPMPMLDDVVNAIPLDRLILESDGNPLVSPEGPLDVIPLAARIAAARKTEPELIGDIATTNLKRLLGI